MISPDTQPGSLSAPDSASPSALILDFGGVISKTLFETHAETEAALGIPSGSLDWLGPFDPANDALWLDMQSDRITERDYWMTRTRQIGKLAGKNWNHMSDLLIATRGDNPNEIIRPEFRELLRRTRSAGRAVAILSNELDLFYGADFRAKLDFLAQIDLIHDATYTHTLKPERSAYDNLLAELGLHAADCVFVDDQKRNIEGAQRAGLKTVHFDVIKPASSFAQAASLLKLQDA